MDSSKISSISTQTGDEIGVRRMALLVIIVAIACIHGLLYVVAVPPWQHYDEPSHFEYAWLIAHQPQWPQDGDVDPGLRRQLAQSMLRHAFFDGMTQADLDNTPDPVSIGLSQIGGAPAYYWLASLPVRLMAALKLNDVTAQLYAMRLVSLVLYGLTVVIAFGVMEIASPQSPLRWMVPLTLALLPAFTDLMTSVNDDVGAVFATSLFIWGSVRVLKQGITIRRLLWVLGAAALCYFTKRTAFTALVLVPVVLLFSLFPKRRQWVAWTVLIAIVIAAPLITLRWGDAARWFRFSAQPTGMACTATTCRPPIGTHAFQLAVTPTDPQPNLQQLIPPETLLQLRGKTVAFGAWIWADVPAQTQMPASTPTLSFGTAAAVIAARQIVIRDTPTFFAMTVTVPMDAERAWFILAPQLPTNSSAQPVHVFYDGVVLVEGEQDGPQPPQFQDESGQQGSWNGRPFVNLIRNGSAEQTTPYVLPSLNGAAQRLLKDSSPAIMLSSLLDWPGSAWYYQLTARVLLESFWARFGWGHVPLWLPQIYTALALLTVAGFAGAVVSLFRQRRVIPWSIVFTLCMALGVTWFFAATRGLFSLFYNAWIPVARYAAPAIIPMCLMLNAGWLEMARIKNFQASRAFKVVVVTAWIVLAGFSLFSLLHFYAAR